MADKIKWTETGMKELKLRLTRYVLDGVFSFSEAMDLYAEAWHAYKGDAK